MRLALTYNRKRTNKEEEAEFDSVATIRALTKILVSLGHAVEPIDVSCSIPHLVGRLRRSSPDLVFNLAEGHRGRFREAFYPALFEQLGVRHTGSTASVLALCLDKALTKRVVAAVNVNVPKGRVVRRAATTTGTTATTTTTTTTAAGCLDVDVCVLLDELAAASSRILVKPNYEGSSKGITQASVVATTDPDKLKTIIEDILDRYPEGVLVEEYIDGIDVAVGWIDGLGILAPIGYAYKNDTDSDTNDAAHRILDIAVKQQQSGANESAAVRVQIPASLDDATSRDLLTVAARVFDALDVTGYGRADFRITPSGEVYFLEMNPLPSLSPDDEELYAAAAWLGRTPRDMLACIVAASRST